MNTLPVERLRSGLQQLPLVAILRGLTPAEAPAIGQALTSAGMDGLALSTDEDLVLALRHYLALRQGRSLHA